MSDKLFRCMSVQNCSESSGQNCICLNCSQMFYLLEREEDFEGMCVLGWGGRSFLMLKYFLLSQLKAIFHIIHLPSSCFFLLSNTMLTKKFCANTWPAVQTSASLNTWRWHETLIKCVTQTEPLVRENCNSTPLCATGCWTSWPGDLRQYGSAVTHPAPSHWTQGPPQGCVLSPLLFTLLTHDCTLSHNSNLFIKFADDTTVVGLISNRDETNYRSEVSRLAGWCRDNNLSLNVEKTKEIVVDVRRVHTQHAPLTINGATVEKVSSTKFLGVHITEDLSWTNTAALAKKAQQRLYFLRKLRRARAPTPIMCTFYRGTIESILTSCITVWYGACNASCRKSLQRIVRAAEKIVGVSLPSLQDIYSTRLTRKALSIAGDPTHPSHSFFSLLPSGRRLRSSRLRTSRLKDSFIHQAVRKLNSLPSLPPPPLLPHATLNSDTTTTPPPPSSPHPQDLHPPPLQTVTRTSHSVQHWTDLYLIQHWL